MTDAEKMREAAAQKLHDMPHRYEPKGGQMHAYIDVGEAMTAIRALPIPVDASAPAADCQQAGLVTVDAPQITIRHGRNNDPYPEGWTLCVADNSVTYKRGGHMDIYTIEKGFLAFAARKEVMPDADQIGNSKPATSPGVTAGAAGLLDEVKAALREIIKTDRIYGVRFGRGEREAWHDGDSGVIARAALARLEREVG